MTGVRPRWIYPALCALSAAGYAAAVLFVRSDNSLNDFLVFLFIFSLLSLIWAVTLGLAHKSPPSKRWIFAVAVLFRLILLPAGFDSENGTYQRLILYDDDIWRYLWEGHAWSAGVNPLRVAPDALEEYELELDNPALYQRLYDSPTWGPVFDNIGYRQFASPYPYAAQAVFRLAHILRPGSVLVFKLLIVSFDLGVVWLLASICRRLGTGDFPVLAYAWNPLVIKEFAGSAHIDAVLIFFLMAALHNVRPRSSLFVAIATLVKPTPLVFLPALYKRLGWLGILAPAGALALIAAAPPEGMKAYAAYWTFNPALPRLLPVYREVELAFLALAVAAAAFIADRRDDGSPQGVFSQGLWLFGAFLLCTPMLAPWYVTWILPFAAIRRAWFWLALSGSVFLSYHAYLRMEENIWLVLLEFSVPLAVWLRVRNRSG